MKYLPFLFYGAYLLIMYKDPHIQQPDLGKLRQRLKPEILVK